jgi:hypothetical protein
VLQRIEVGGLKEVNEYNVAEVKREWSERTKCGLQRTDGIACLQECRRVNGMDGEWAGCMEKETNGASGSLSTRTQEK